MGVYPSEGKGEMEGRRRDERNRGGVFCSSKLFLRKTVQTDGQTGVVRHKRVMRPPRKRPHNNQEHVSL